MMGDYSLPDHGDYGPHVSSRAICARLREFRVPIEEIDDAVHAAMSAAYDANRSAEHRFRSGCVYRAADAVWLAALARAERAHASRGPGQMPLFAEGRK